MTFDVDVGGRVRLVSIDALDVSDAGGRLRVRLGSPDGASRVFDLDVRQTDLGLSILDRETGRVVDAAVTDRTGVSLVQFPHISVDVIVDGSAARRVETGGALAGGEVRLTAPMPGRVLRVLVRPGDEVAAGQGLVVVEAMKMENELTAVRAGRVREVAAREGTSVEAGRLLVVIE